jgi:hypothetical protein
MRGCEFQDAAVCGALSGGVGDGKGQRILDAHARCGGESKTHCATPSFALKQQDLSPDLAMRSIKPLKLTDFLESVWRQEDWRREKKWEATTTGTTKQTDFFRLR